MSIATPNLDAAISDEMDLDESPRWVGRPNVRTLRARLMIQFLFIPVVISFFVLLAMLPDIIAPMREGLRRQGITIAGADLLANIIFFVIAWRAADGMARRTVYAVTQTRLIRLCLSRKGLPRVESFEPAHPLHVQRFDRPGNRGTIVIGPSPKGLVLLAIESPREVERIIRGTFDPA